MSKHSPYRSDFVQKLETKSNDEEYNAKFSEWKIAVYGLFISLSIITAKLIYANRNALHNLVFEEKLLSYETIGLDGEAMLRYVRKTVLRSSRTLFALSCGLAMTAFTWLMVYLDSSVPGVQPPTPFSPNKYKLRSGHSFHLGYVIAIVNGLLVSTLIFLSGFNI